MNLKIFPQYFNLKNLLTLSIQTLFISAYGINSFGNPIVNTSNGSEFKNNKTIHIKDFGAIGNGLTNCTKAFQDASSYLQANGGTLIIDSGTYIVGKQRLSGSYLAGSSYFATPILEFNNALFPINIVGYNAILKAAAGLKYGSFNPISGEEDSVRDKGNISSYSATAYMFINAIGCSAISIKGLTLDGNSGALRIGPSSYKEGIQLMATGIRVYNNKKVDIEDCYIHHCGLDAIIVGWTGLKKSDPIYYHTIKNVRALFNGRQGLSWVGGNDLTVINSEFSSTGKALNKGGPVKSEPGAGIDIEIEESIIRNGSFINCFVFDNSGSGIISIAHDTYNINFDSCTFIGTTNSAAYPRSQCFSFSNCTFVGKVERILGATDKTKATFFKNCLFTMDSTMSPNGKVFGDHCEFYEGENVIFNNCKFNADSRALPVFNNKEILFLNCEFQQKSDKDFNASANFSGTTRFIMRGKGKINKSQATFEGDIFYNNKKIADPKDLN